MFQLLYHSHISVIKPVCQESLEPFYIASYYTKWVKTSCTDSNIQTPLPPLNSPLYPLLVIYQGQPDNLLAPLCVRWCTSQGEQTKWSCKRTVLAVPVLARHQYSTTIYLSVSLTSPVALQLIYLTCSLLPMHHSLTNLMVPTLDGKSQNKGTRVKLNR